MLLAPKSCPLLSPNSSQGEGLGMVVIGVLMGSGSQRLVLGLRTETHIKWTH